MVYNALIAALNRVGGEAACYLVNKYKLRETTPI